jgi:hypothetical protein
VNSVAYSVITSIPATWNDSQIPTLAIGKISGLQGAKDAKTNANAGSDGVCVTIIDSKTRILLSHVQKSLIQLYVENTTCYVIRLASVKHESRTSRYWVSLALVGVVHLFVLSWVQFTDVNMTNNGDRHINKRH